MEGWQHFLASIFLASLLLVTEPVGNLPLSYLLIGVASGTLIDLDHFIVSRIRHGDWHHLKNTVQTPLTVFLNYRESKETTDDSYFGSIRQIYISHIIFGALISALISFLVTPEAGIIAAIFILLHILMDFLGLLNLIRKGEIG